MHDFIAISAEASSESMKYATIPSVANQCYFGEGSHVPIKLIHGADTAIIDFHVNRTTEGKICRTKSDSLVLAAYPTPETKSPVNYPLELLLSDIRKVKKSGSKSSKPRINKLNR
jgi:hypothetical protein